MAAADDTVVLPNPEVMIVTEAFAGRDQVTVRWLGMNVQYRDPARIAAILRLAADICERGRLSIVPTPAPDRICVVCGHLETEHSEVGTVCYHGIKSPTGCHCIKFVEATSAEPPP